jgi:hypothetical protein
VVEDRAGIDIAAPKATPVAYLDAKNPHVPPDGTVIPPLTEAIHGLHLRLRPLPDGKIRSGSCQGCHPAHRFDREMLGYRIIADGRNAFSGEPGSLGNDNRDGSAVASFAATYTQIRTSSRTASDSISI